MKLHRSSSEVPAKFQRSSTKFQRSSSEVPANFQRSSSEVPATFQPFPDSLRQIACKFLDVVDFGREKGQASDYWSQILTKEEFHVVNLQIVGWNTAFAASKPSSLPKNQKRSKNAFTSVRGVVETRKMVVQVTHV